MSWQVMGWPCVCRYTPPNPRFGIAWPAVSSNLRDALSGNVPWTVTDGYVRTATLSTFYIPASRRHHSIPLQRNAAQQRRDILVKKKKPKQANGQRYGGAGRRAAPLRLHRALVDLYGVTIVTCTRCLPTRVGVLYFPGTVFLITLASPFAPHSRFHRPHWLPVK